MAAEKVKNSQDQCLYFHKISESRINILTEVILDTGTSTGTGSYKLIISKLF